MVNDDPNLYLQQQSGSKCKACVMLLKGTFWFSAATPYWRYCLFCSMALGLAKKNGWHKGFYG